LNGITVFSKHFSVNPSFHPNQEGNDAMAHLVEQAFPHLDWSDLQTPESRAAAQLAVVAPGMRQTIVIVGTGYEAATYDPAGDIDFWQYTHNHWTRIGHSSCNTLPDPPDPTITGALLDGMGTATFIATGMFTADGSLNYIAFGDGPHGWGAIGPSRIGNRLVMTGRPAGSVFSQYWREYFFDGSLATEIENPYFTTAQGGQYPLITYWRWDYAKNYFVDAHDNAFTATQANPPPASQPHLGTCATRNLYGTFGEQIQVETPHTYGVDEDLSVTVDTPPSGPVCTFRVAPDIPTTLKIETTSGGSQWITAPAWILEAGMPLTGGVVPIFYVAPGQTPWVIPPRFHPKAITSYLGVPASDVFPGCGCTAAPTYGDITIAHGVVHSIGLTLSAVPTSQ